MLYQLIQVHFQNLRHYTNRKGINGIERDGTIIAKDQNSVFTVRAKGKPGSPRDIEESLGILRGRGREYIEFDASIDEISIIVNKKTGATEYVLKGNVSLKGRKPVFRRR